MAIKNLFGRGIGFNGGVVGWVVTHGYGNLSAGGGGGGAAPGGFVSSQQTQWVIPTRVNTDWAEPAQVGGFTVTAP